jgi:hypothetical protein
VELALVDIPSRSPASPYQRLRPLPVTLKSSAKKKETVSKFDAAKGVLFHFLSSYQVVYCQ